MGKTITVSVTATDSTGSSAPVAASPTAAVTAGPAPVNTAAADDHGAESPRWGKR